MKASAIMLPDAVLERTVPKHALTLEEVEFALASAALVRDLRRIGALAPAYRRTKTLLFDAADVARVWVEVRNGKYTEDLR